jgi:hypothetical protein
MSGAIGLAIARSSFSVLDGESMGISSGDMFALRYEFLSDLRLLLSSEVSPLSPSRVHDPRNPQDSLGSVLTHEF